MMIEETNVYKNLKRSVDKNRVTHAYLFVGEKGTGKLEMARTFAKMLLCTGANKPCNECSSCKQVDTFNHPNVINIEADGQYIKKEQIERLQKEFSKTSLIDGKRIYIINEADKLSTVTANNLLKFIEEPVNKDTVGILISDNYSSILPTIISRCQVILFPSPTKDVFLKGMLEKGYDEAISRIVQRVTTNIDEAINIIENTSFKQLIEVVLKMGSQYVNNKSMILIFNSNSKLIFEGNNASLFIKLLISYFMDILYIKNNSHDLTFINEEETIKTIASKRSNEAICASINSLLECDIRNKYNVNSAMLIIRALLEIERS